MKAVIFLACVAFAAAVPLWGGYQQKTVHIDEYGKIWVTSQGWKVMVHKPMEHAGHVEVVVTGDDGYHRQVVIDHQFQIVKDNYLGHEYHFDDQYTGYPHVGFWSKYYGGFDQFEYLHNIFSHYVGPVDQQVWDQLLFKLLNEVQLGKVHYVFHEIFMNFGKGETFHQGFEGHYWPNYQWVNNQHYQTIEEHIQHAREMYHFAQRNLALFEQYGPEHHFWTPEHLQYFKDWVHVAHLNLQHLLALQQNPEYVKYGIQNPWYGKNFGQNWYGKQYTNELVSGQYQGPWNQHHYGADAQFQYVQNRIHYIRWQLINFHHKSQEIFHQQQLIHDQIAQLHTQFQIHGEFNQQWVEQMRQLYHQFGMLVQQQVTMQLWIQQLHHDLDVQVHHWKQVTPYHHDIQVYPEHQVYGEYEHGYPEYQQYSSHHPDYQQYGFYQPEYHQYKSYQPEYQQPWYSQVSWYGSYPSTWGKSLKNKWNNWWTQPEYHQYKSYQPEYQQPWYGQGSWYGSYPSTWGKSLRTKWNNWWTQ